MTKIVKYSAEWCAPCKKFAPIVHKVVEELRSEGVNITLEDVDVDKTPTPGILSVPTVQVVDDSGTVLGERSGAMSKNTFKKFVEETANI